MDYKDKLKLAKEALDSGSYDKETIEYIFPELAESEDERIRKALIDGFTVMKESKNCGKTFSNHNIPVVDILTWLEKQGNKPQSKTALETWKDMRLEVYQQASGNRHEPNYSDDTTKMFSLNDIDEIIEKISEQKPINKTEVSISKRNPVDEDIKDCIRMCLTDANEQRFEAYGTTFEDCLTWLERQGGQKPKWGEEEPNCVYNHTSNNPQITIGTKIRSKTNSDIILSIISNDCHEDKFECSNGSVLSLKQIEKYYDIII